MKRLFCCTVLFLILQETSIISQPFNFKWARSFGGSNSEEPRFMKLDKQGNVYLFFETWSDQFSIENKFFYSWIFPENRPINNVLLKYNKNGNLLWGKSLQTDGGLEATGLTIDNENNVILSTNFQGSQLFFDTLNIFSISKFGIRTLILKLNSSGSLLDFAFFETNREIIHLGGISHDSQNNYYFTCRVDRDILDRKGDTILKIDLKKGLYLVIFKLDKNFNVVWTKKIYNSNAYSYDTKVDNEDNIIVYGMFSDSILIADSFKLKNAESNFLLGNLGDDEIFLLKLSPDGKANWLQAINGKDVEYCGYNDITFDNDNNIYLGGMFESDTLTFTTTISLFKDKKHNNYFDLFYAKYSARGECIWARTIERQIKDLADNMTIHLLNEDYLILSSNYTNNNLKIGNTNLTNKGLSDCFVLLAKTNGEIITGTSFGGTKEDYEQQLASKDKELFIFAMFGSNELKFNDAVFRNDTTDGSLDAILIKYSLDSLVSTNDVAGKAVNIHIFPNPATTSISLQLPENFEMGLCYYNIYSITGDFITSGIMQSTNAEVHLNSFPPGEYVLSGGNLKGNKFSGKFIVVR